MKKAILMPVLTPLARLYLWRFRPQIIAITGNAGKTTTKEAIATVMAGRYRIRATGGNLNNELGTPATIIGDFSDQYYRGGGTWGFWFGVVMRGVIGLFASRSSYPEILVLEYGAGKPGDIKYLVDHFPPHISVITQIGEVPVHVEFFASAEHLAQEKMQIIKHLTLADHAVLNYDDQTVFDMRSHTQARVHTFGLGRGADVQVTEVAPRLDGDMPLGINFNMTSQGNTMPAVVSGTIGAGIASACAAAVSVGALFGIGLADAVSAFTHLKAPAGRMRILQGIKNTVIIDDTYNASPAAMHLAIDTVRGLPGRKVLVLGDMLELGQHSVQAHQAIGSMAAEVADVLVCVGERARFYADAASDQMPSENIHWFHDANEAKGTVQALLKSGDLVLVKASQGIRLERIVREIMAEPQRASELLARQSTLWLRK